MSGGSFCGARSRGSIPVGPVVTTLKSGLNVDSTEKILLVSMCRFSIESVEHPRASNNVAAHTTPISFLAIDIGAIYRIDVAPQRQLLPPKRTFNASSWLAAINSTSSTNVV